MKQVVKVNPVYLDQEWPKFVEYLQLGLLYCEEETTIDQLRMEIAKGAITVLVAVDDGEITGACAIEPLQYPNFRAAHIVSAGAARGASLFTEEYYPLLVGWCKKLGYSKIQGHCRPSVARLIKRVRGANAREPYALIRMDIGD